LKQWLPLAAHICAAFVGQVPDGMYLLVQNLMAPTCVHHNAVSRNHIFDSGFVWLIERMLENVGW
jgi:hypothetical protein